MEQGYEDAEAILDVKDLYDPREQWASFVLNAIKAKELFLRDVNYIIRGKEVLIVDEFTGRVMQVNLHLGSVSHKKVLAWGKFLANCMLCILLSALVPFIYHLPEKRKQLLHGSYVALSMKVSEKDWNVTSSLIP
jgi:hypothetical protein